MKNLNYKRVIYCSGFITLTLLLVIVPGVIEVAAQSIPGPPQFPNNPDAVPIDGGLALLAAAGGGYAIKKLRDRKEH